jgi:CheY-like chemotaxis protein
VTPDPALRTSVLVVDDDVDLQRVMTKFLALEGFAPIVAGNGQEALDRLRDGAHADVILLDLRMPVMDGWTFRREQRLDPRIASVPVVVLSGTETDRMAEIDAAAWFSKPVSFPEVIAAIRRLSGRTPSA